MLASGLPIQVGAGIAGVAETDIIIVPLVIVGSDGWAKGRYKPLVDWAAARHAEGALLCSACSDVFLLAETGLFDGHDATVHWGYGDHFHRAFPAVRFHPERTLVVSCARDDLVSSGASNTWHDLALYLIARHVGAIAAQVMARTFALQWHVEGLAPFMIFRPSTDHGDAVIAEAQRWLDGHFAIARPVDEMVTRAGIPERTFKRWFKIAMGLAPLDYVHRLRVEDAKRRLERTEAPIDEIGWRVGYEDSAFFRRLFRRLTGLAPGAYRRKFQVPAFARTGAPRLIGFVTARIGTSRRPVGGTRRRSGRRVAHHRTVPPRRRHR